jgi:tetratricopeptide (TPR) repeat protein
MVTHIRPLSIRAGGMVAALALVLAACGGADERVAKHADRGAAFVTEGNLDKARVEYRNALQIDPKNAAVMLELAKVEESQGDLQRASSGFQSAIEQSEEGSPTQLEARANFGRMLVFAGLAERAREVVEPGLAVDPSHPQLLTVRAAARNKLGDTIGAFEDVEAALVKQPDSEEALALYASLWLVSSRQDKAIETLEQGIKRLPRSIDLRLMLAESYRQMDRNEDALATLAQAIELDRKRLDLRYYLARTHLALKDVDAAENVLRAAVTEMPESVEAKLALADLLAAHRSAEVAERELRALVAAQPDDVDLRLGLGRYLESRGETAKARAAYEEIVAQDEDAPAALTARNRIAALLIREQKLKEAEAVLAEVLERNPQDTEGLMLRGNIALASGRPTDAIADLRAVLRDQPNSVPVMRSLARSHLVNGEPALAEEVLKNAVQANPKDYDARLELAQVLAQQNKTEESLPIYEQLSRERPSEAATLEQYVRLLLLHKDWARARAVAANITTARPDLGLGHFLTAAAAEGEGKPDEVERELEAALALQPDATEPLSSLVRVYLSRGEGGKAMARLDKAIAVTAESGGAAPRNLKGELLLSRKEFDAAEQMFKASIERAPTWWLPYRNLAMCDVGRGDREAAIASFRKGYEKTGSAMIAGELAAYFERIGRPDDAIATYEDLVRKNPDSDIAANNLAMLLATYRSAKNEDLVRAETLSKRFSDSDNPAYLNTYGWVKYQQGQTEAALASLSEAVQRAPDSALFRYHLGLAQYRAGQVEDARSNLEQALASQPDLPGAAEARSLLDGMNKS